MSASAGITRCLAVGTSHHRKRPPPRKQCRCDKQSLPRIRTLSTLQIAGHLPALTLKTSQPCSADGEISRPCQLDCCARSTACSDANANVRAFQGLDVQHVPALRNRPKMAGEGIRERFKLVVAVAKGIHKWPLQRAAVMLFLFSPART